MSIPRSRIRVITSERNRLSQEFVSGGVIAPWYTNARKQAALPIAPDDITQEFGLEVYEKMLLDSQVAACTTFWKAAILEEGLQLTPAVNDPEEDGYERSKDLVDEARKMFDQMDTDLDDVLWDMLNCVALCNKVAELVYTIRDNRLDLVKIKVKPSRAVAMVVDQFLNLVGVIGASPGQTVVNTSILSTATVLPPDKFAILSFRPKDSDPRGSSVLRPAYSPWWRKQQMIPEYMKFLAQFASRTIIGYTPENVESTPIDPDNPDSEVITPEEYMVDVLEDWRNGSVAAFPAGTKVDIHGSEGEGKAFISAFASWNLEMTKAILTQELATEQGEYMARAAAQVHQDVLGTLIRQGKRAVVRMMKRQVLQRWVSYNYGPDLLPLTPNPSLGTVEHEDLSTLMNAIASLTRASYFSPEQLPEIDKLLGFPVRSKTPIEAEEQMAAEEEPNQEQPQQPNNNEENVDDEEVNDD